MRIRIIFKETNVAIVSNNFVAILCNVFLSLFQRLSVENPCEIGWSCLLLSTKVMYATQLS